MCHRRAVFLCRSPDLLRHQGNKVDIHLSVERQYQLCVRRFRGSQGNFFLRSILYKAVTWFNIYQYCAAHRCFVRTAQKYTYRAPLLGPHPDGKVIRCPLCRDDRARLIRVTETAVADYRAVFHRQVTVIRLFVCDAKLFV